MRVPESDQESNLSVSPDFISEAGPSSIGSFSAGPSNGHMNGNGNGFTSLATNGHSSSSLIIGNGVQKLGKSVAKVSLPGTALYEGSYIDREEFVRLVIQSLRDVGYVESAATLEAESGYAMESPEVVHFRESVLNGNWIKAESILQRLISDEDSLWEARFIIAQQKYLELLEAQKTTAALSVLRNELTPLNVDPDELHSLSSLIMCSDPEDLRHRAGWDGANGTSRQRLLTDLQHHIPPAVMIPQKRIATLLEQAFGYQRYRCLYHTAPLSSSAYSLYMDHHCDRNAFPTVTTAILEIHEDEVWNIEWSHSGTYLASAGKDKAAIIWRIGPETEPSIRIYEPHLILRDHPASVGCLAWSNDDSILSTSAESCIKIWNTKTGVCIENTAAHSETVTALSWLPDDSGFVSAALDRRIIVWDRNGKQRDNWGLTPTRLTGLAVTPDGTRLVTIGMSTGSLPSSPAAAGALQGGDGSALPVSGSVPTMNGSGNTENRLIVYDMATKAVETSIPLEGELTNVKVSKDSRYALINHSTNELLLWDLAFGRLARKYNGQQQGHHVIRSCFGGIDENFIISGSEDSNVYIWHRDTGALLEVLPGHGYGSVNSVAWNPRNDRMFASCSDDSTIRIWEPPPLEARDWLSNGIDRSELTAKLKGKTRQREDVTQET